jgi:hypothetical protein
LQYVRLPVAEGRRADHAGHCRRRKIRCLPANPEDSAGRCANCIRLKKDCTFFPVDHGAANMRAGGSPLSSSSSSSPPPLGALTPRTESAQSPPLEEPAIISLPAPEELPSQLAGASSRSYSTGYLPAAVSNGLAIQPSFMISQAAEHEGWQSPPFPHAEASPYWGSGESTPNPSAFQQMPELTPTSSGPPFAGAMAYPQQQWAAQGRSASFGQLEGVHHHHPFYHSPELATATDLAASLQYSQAGIPAPHVERSPAVMLAGHHPHMAGPPPGFPYQQPPQAWVAQQQPGVSTWYSEPSSLTELDVNEQEAADPFAGTVSPIYPHRQNTS